MRIKFTNGSVIETLECKEDNGRDKNMIDGVTILNEYMSQDMHYSYAILVAISCFIISFLIGYAGERFIVYSTILATVCTILVSLILYFGCDFTKYKVYEVTIESNVDFKEFDNKYEVIERKGAIYKIKERTECD